MQTVRRLYIYLVAFISLELVVWGSIGLLRAAIGEQGVGSGVVRLAGALALVFVGVPVFAIHWTSAQRAANRDPEERFSRLRSIFLYGTLLAVLIPIVQNISGLFDGLFLKAFGAESDRGIFGLIQPLSYSLVAIFINAVAAVYFISVLRLDWRAQPHNTTFAETRRLYRYIWLIYGLVMVAAGTQQLIQFILDIQPGVGWIAQARAAHGLALILVGLPLWLYVSQIISQSLADQSEKGSLLRLVILYLIVFLSAFVALLSGGMILYEILRIALGAPTSVINFLPQVSTSLSTVIPAAAVWVYYGRMLAEFMRPEATTSPADEPFSVISLDRDYQQRAALKRLYAYVLAFLGLTVAFIGLQELISVFLDLAAENQILAASAIQNRVAGSLAALLVGLPVWLLNWRPMSAEARSEGETGDHARRSIIRKGYLYLILFASVVGIMVTAGFILYHIIRAILGDPVDNLALVVSNQFLTLLMFGTIGSYHWLAIRKDASLAERSLDRLYGQFPVIILSLEGSDFGTVVGDVFQKVAPAMPVAVHLTSDGAPDQSLLAARAVVMPSELAARPSESIRLWLQGFSGERVVITTQAEGWNWVPKSSANLDAMARQAVHQVSRLAEGLPGYGRRESGAFLVVVYIFAGLFTLELILFALSLGISLIFG